ncbi:Ig-like domain-containing protein [Streptomyces sp. NBC_01275]|uniref:L,D-transpeptidase n=1 Tax=Streptomyces sp. NBC_01275 TaxID=2903807 RepID=UPI00224D5327|nr:Ig-like domain-containing protein [Streptomyces sp. NBC_01275]MCX4765909.1 Ig-like domain-containing protein [Streptomyces sp. NBC_01275]
MSSSRRGRAAFRRALAAALLGVTVSACGDGGRAPHAEPPGVGPRAVLAVPAGSGVRSGAGGAVAGADPERPLEVAARGRDVTLADVSAVDSAGRRLAGELSADGSRWRSVTPLAAGTRYTVEVATEHHGGSPGRTTLHYETAPAERELRIAFGPGAGPYGVGQPITARLDAPVKGRKARALVESALRVDSSPAAEGAWHWVDATTLHYRPRTYWPARATIHVHSELRGIRLVGRLYGGAAEPLTLTTGDRVEAVVDAAARTMTVRRGDTTVRTIPVTTGKPGFATRNGFKVVLGRERVVRMRSASIGIPASSGESYDHPVHYAVRLTLSGEYAHAAPWSQGSLGRSDVSHGCVGMSTADAAWFYRAVRAGDVVRVAGSRGKPMPAFGNGFGDWNLSWEQWRQGSALPAAGPRPDSRRPGSAARLRPRI